ncbi:MAG: type II toxin-antitoxin system RelB/DinJ family antitoxin [Verrucomicrobiaceae bacterium]|nr:MAG: type II toxin-antitoxin system RelB/DinJ family antitoxin [Verrucomicrobiaceae bacterium]
MKTLQKTLQIRLPRDLREEADSVLGAIGLDMPTAVRLFLTRIVQTRSIPFALEAGPVETISVDQETQTRMEAVAAAWSAKKRTT